ncbi:MAG: diacylglycerol kinase family lipid kinase [Clostridia bacterium]|nr:diacylglycerol kinase family lipid kinase [Clostridia bacterium]
MMKYLFIINPTAGKGNRQEDIIKGVKAFFSGKDADYEIYLTTAPGDAKQKANTAAKSGEDLTVFACGGEGTVFEVLNGIVGFSNVVLGVVPCGSANDFLKFFPDSTPFSDIAAQIDGVAVLTDIIKANEYYCLNGCSVGMDAVVARDMSIFKRWRGVSGPMAYKLAVLKTFFGKIGVSVELSVDGGEPRREDCLFAVIANAPYYGGGYKSAPEANPFDNELDFTKVDTISKLKVPKFLSLYEKGEHGVLDYCTLKRCSAMEFCAKSPVPVNLDGEIIETKNMRFEIVKGGVRFVLPRPVYESVKNSLKVIHFA